MTKITYLFRLNWLRYFQVRRIRQYSRAWIADDGALVLITRKDR